MPLEARFAYDAERNTFFLNMESMTLVSRDEVEAIGTEVDKLIMGTSIDSLPCACEGAPPPPLESTSDQTIDKPIGRLGVVI